MDRLESVSRRAEEAPDDPGAWLEMAEALIELGAEAPARYVLDRARACDPATADQWFSLGRLFHRLNDRDGALEALRAACVLDPVHRDAVLLFARTAAEAGQLTEAEERLRRSLELGEEPELRHLLSSVLAQSSSAELPAFSGSGAPGTGLMPAGGLTGDLSVFRLEEILEFLGVQRATGELHIVSSDQHAVIELLEGRLTDVVYPSEPPFPDALLGLAEAPAALGGGGSLGPRDARSRLRLRVERGEVSRTVVEELMRDRIEAGIGLLLGWSEGHIRFEKKALGAPLVAGFTHQLVLMSLMKSWDEGAR